MISHETSRLIIRPLCPTALGLLTLKIALCHSCNHSEVRSLIGTSSYLHQSHLHQNLANITDNVSMLSNSNKSYSRFYGSIGSIHTYIFPASESTITHFRSVNNISSELSALVNGPFLHRLNDSPSRGQIHDI